MARGCAHPSGVIQRTVGATLYLDGCGAGAGAVSSRVHAPAPRWDSAPLAKIHNPAAATHRPGRVQQCRHAAELYDGLDAAAEPRCADLHLQTVRPLRPHERASRGRRPLCQQMRARGDLLHRVSYEAMDDVLEGMIKNGIATGFGDEWSGSAPPRSTPATGRSLRPENLISLSIACTRSRVASGSLRERDLVRLIW
jgi:hypothetical protein